MRVHPAFVGRRAAIVAAGLILASVIGLVVLALGLWRGSQLRIRQNLEAEILAYRSRVNQAAGIATVEAEFEHRLRTAPALVHISDTPRAAAELQASVRQIAASCGGDVRSAQVLPFHRRGAFDVIAIQTEVVVPAAKLPALLYAVETHKPYIFVASADIVAPMKFDKDSIFDVQWVLHAYRWHAR